MRKTFFISLLALCFAASTWAVNVAKIGDTYYATLPAAVAAAIQSNSASVTIELVGTPGASIQGSGVKIPTANKTIIIDFKGMTYVAGDPAVGSTGTETQAFQLLRDNNITLKNGTITSLAGSNVRMLIQNYSNLTLENITLDGSNLNIPASGAYTLSNNNGDVVIGNGTEVIAKDGGFAFDVCYYATYPSVHVTVEAGATINGAVEMSMSSGRGATVEENCELTIEGGEFTNFSISHSNIPEASVNSNISGGTFDAEVPAVYFAEGAAPVDNGNGTWSVQQQYVAKIGATLYPTLEAALAHASEGAIILLADVDVTAQVEIAAGVNAIIDLAGHKIEYTGATTLPSGVLLVHNGANLTINDSSDPDAGAIVSGNNAYAAIALTKAGDNAANPAVLTINGGTLTGYYYAITGNGSRHNTITTINGGIINATCPGDNLGIYHPQIGTLTINNGTITAYSAAVEMRAGTLEINGGTLTATAPTFSCNANGSGTTTTGAAIAIAQHTTKKDIAVTINGGTFNGIKAVNESNPQVNDPAPQVDMAVTNGEFNGAVETVDVNNFVTGGTFNAPVAEAYCAPGFVSVTAPNAQGKYVVEPVDYQREVTNTYGTLCLPKSGVVIGATVFQPSYKTGCMIVFDEVAENRIEGGHAYLFQRNANSGRVSVKYDANAQYTDIVGGEAMVGKSYTENTLIDSNYDHCIVWNDKYLHVTSANVYVGANCAYIDLNQISDSYVAPVPGRRRISFQDASVNEVTGIEDIEANENAGVQKVMINGQLYILRGEQIYNVAGQVVK